MIMVKAMEMCGDNLTRDEFIRVVESIKNFKTGGITGEISYSKGDHCPLTAMRIVKANPKTNRYEAVTDWGITKLKIRNN